MKERTDIYCNKQGVVNRTSFSESMLNKKHNSINYHVVLEATAARILRIGKRGDDNNLANLLTNLMPYSKTNEFLGHIFY